MLHVSLVFAGALALLNLWLAYRVIRVRVRAGAIMGDGGNPLLLARMRAQANFVEYTPFVLILMALLEYGGASPLWLRIAGTVYVLARVAHAFGMDRKEAMKFRQIGACLTWLVLLALACWAIWASMHPTIAPMPAPMPAMVTRPI